MGYDKYLHVGDRVSIVYDNEIYNSKIVRFIKKVKGVETIVILLPTKNDFSMNTDDDKKKYEVLFYTKGGIYKGEFKIKDRYKEDGTAPVVEIVIISDLEKDQRREYFRIDYFDHIQFRATACKDEETGEIKSVVDDWHEGALTNISGGGLRFNSSEGMENVARVKVKFKLRDNKMVNEKNVSREDGEFDVEADVVGFKIRAHSEKRYDYRVRFKNIDRVDRENIVKFVFERERWMRKRSNGKF